MAPDDDPVRPGPTSGITLVVDGVAVPGLAGQTVAGVLMATGRLAWCTTRGGRPRGVFCGIGVCHDCLITINGVSDVRACRRRAVDGDTVSTEESA